MKSIFIASGLCAVLMASPALALKVTNLDQVPHTVQLTGSGAPEQRLIAPNATENFTGAAQGFLSLADRPVNASQGSVVQMDGLLAGVIGNGRRDQVAADPDNSYVIWPGGDLRLQSRIKSARNR